MRNPFPNTNADTGIVSFVIGALIRADRGAGTMRSTKRLYHATYQGDFRSFISATSATQGRRDGEPFYEDSRRQLDVREIVYTPFRER